MLKLLRSTGSKRCILILDYAREFKNSIHVLVAALMRGELPVDICLNYDPLTPNSMVQISRLAEKYENVIWGMTIYTTQLPIILGRLRRFLRSLPKNVIPIAGGPHPTGDPLGTLKLGFRTVFVGEAEASLLEYLERIVGGEDPLETSGISYLEDDKLKYNPSRRNVDLDSYPPIEPRYNLYNPIEITRGCPYSCGYCQTPVIFGNKPRHRSVENIRYWALEMLKRGLRDLRFITPNALSYGSLSGTRPDLSSIEELLSKLRTIADKYRGRIFYGSFPSEIRPEFVDEDLLRVLRENVDNKRIIIGAQSGSDRMLRRIGRGHSVEDVYEAVVKARNSGFEVDVDFIFGLPGEGEEDVEDTLKFLEKLVKLKVRIHAHTFIPLPSTPLWRYRPGKVHEKYKKLLLKIIGKGLVYGYWDVQEKLAEEIYQLKVKGVIRV